MSLSKRARNKNRHSSFVAFQWVLLNSKVYWDLKPSAAKALPYFLGKPKRPFNDPEMYAKKITFSYNEAKRYGFSSSTFYKIIVELVGKGFIDPVEKGGLRSDEKTYNKFKLSRRWEKYDTPEFIPMKWAQFIQTPKHRATPKSETYRSKKGNELTQNNATISQNEVVGPMST